MNRTNLAFALLVVGSLAVGGAAAAAHVDDLRTLDAAGDVRERLSVNVERTAVEDERLLVRVTVHNPSGRTVNLRGASFRLARGDTLRVASGAGRRLDDNGTTVPAGGRLTARYAVSIAPDAVEDARDALDGGARLAVRLSLRLEDTPFDHVSESPVGGGET